MYHRPPIAFAATADLALLIDGENLPAACARAILDQAGGARIRRVDGKAQHLAAWEAVPGLLPVMVPAGKNAADIRMAVDAVDLAHRGGIGGVALATSDGDFASVATHLREMGLIVLGIGRGSARPAAAGPDPGRDLGRPGHRRTRRADEGGSFCHLCDARRGEPAGLSCRAAGPLLL